MAEEQLRASEAGRLALHAKLSNEGEGAAAQYEARIASLQRQLAQARAEGHELREWVRQSQQHRSMAQPLLPHSPRLHTTARKAPPSARVSEPSEWAMPYPRQAVHTS